MPDAHPTGEYEYRPLPIRQIVRRFEEALRSGVDPALDDFLQGDGPDRWNLLLELVHSDLELRLRAGQTIGLADYLTRYPGLTHFPNELAAVLETEVGFLVRAGRAPNLVAYEARYSALGRRVREVFRRVGTVPPDVTGYEVGEKLGEGGMGTVYRARQLLLRREVALKVIRGDRLGGSDGDRFRARFRREAEAVAAVNHPGVVQVYEYGDSGGDLFLAMELVDGPSLQKKLDRDGVPAPRAAAELLEAVARAVHAVHARGIVHRDLKPDNVLLTADGTPKVTDFGLARPADVSDGRTRAGVFVGTPEYSSPEQAAMTGEDPTPRTDVYGLGAILYACLTGHPPFPREDVLATLEKVRTQPVVAVCEVRPDCPRDLETICHKCLEKEPGRRYESADALANDLRRWLDGKPILARPVGPAERAWKWTKRNRAVSAALLALVSALLAATAAALFRAELANQKEAVALRERAYESERGAIALQRAAELEREKQETQAAQERADRNRVRGYLRAIGHNTGTSHPDHAEWAALEALALREEDRAKLLFLEEALADPEAAFRVTLRASAVIQAVVGLSAKRRTATLDMLSRRAQVSALAPLSRLCMVWLQTELGGCDPNEFARTTATVPQSRYSVAYLDAFSRVVKKVPARGDAFVELDNQIEIERLRIILSSDEMKRSRRALVLARAHHPPSTFTAAARVGSELRLLKNGEYRGIDPSVLDREILIANEIDLHYLAQELLDVCLETPTDHAVRLSFNSFCHVLDRLPQADRQRYRERITAAFRDSIRGMTSNTLKPVRERDAVCQIFLSNYNSIPQVIELLRDPRCVEAYQDAALRRLDDLVRPQPALAPTLVGLGAMPTGTFAIAGALELNELHRNATRLFRTVSDVSLWVSKHHPEIDLEKPYEEPQKP